MGKYIIITFVILIIFLSKYNLSNNQLNIQIKFLKNLTIKTIFIKIIIKKKMKISFIILNILLAFICKQTSATSLNQEVLIETYGFNINSVEIDLSDQNINEIDVDTFNGFNNLEILNLEGNLITRLDNIFIGLLNLRELWLQSNRIISVDFNIFVGLNKLEKVCFGDNPISEMYPERIKQFCSSNPKCVIYADEKCIKTTPSNLSL